ncbi:hypothetical protein DPMN_020618 [Dreissena polymorpha]|uniref:Uncharacterized protein n=1 Tax=Dreissena polymorpha TaxID=45954 RepID=A0A9D4NLG8_DREPO|nr:hypothetical protein DPMN_020618 [Dreissena polymorpha]
MLGPQLQQFDPVPAVKKWLSDKKRRKKRLREAYKPRKKAKTCHKIDPNKTKVLTSEEHLWKRKVKEAIEIKQRRPSLNRDEGLELPRRWTLLWWLLRFGGGCGSVVVVVGISVAGEVIEFVAVLAVGSCGVLVVFEPVDVKGRLWLWWQLVFESEVAVLF